MRDREFESTSLQRGVSANTYDVFLGAALIYLALTPIAGLVGKLASPA